MKVEIRDYQKADFGQVCHVMDEGRKQELASENLSEVFIALKDAPYLKYFLAHHIKVALMKDKVVGFVGYGRHRLEFLYVDPDFQDHGIGTKLMKVALKNLERPIKLCVFSDNQKAKQLYEKFGFKVVDTLTERWSDEVPKIYSEDTMELK